MSNSRTASQSHRRGNFFLDASFGPEVKWSRGPFTETGEYLPCMMINYRLFRIEIIGVEHVLFFWDEDVELWEEIARTRDFFKISTIMPILDDFFYIKDLADQEEEFTA